jgi:thymidylate synthase (FAD)
MKVKLMYDIEGIIKAYVGGKTCYSPDGPIEIYKDLQREINSLKTEDNAVARKRVEKFIERILSMGHNSVIEHWNVTILVEGISRSLAMQLIRHRLASYSMQSQRYVTVNKMFEFVTPPKIAENPKLLENYQDAMRDSYAYYSKIYEGLLDNYLIEGIDKNKADKLAAEDARYVLPNAITSNIVTTVNMRELMHMMEERLCLRAQWEIRGLFKEIRKELLRDFPFMKKYLGPKCMFRPCTEEDDCDMKKALSNDNK